MTPEQGSSNRSIRRLNPTVRTTAKSPALAMRWNCLCSSACPAARERKEKDCVSRSEEHTSELQSQSNLVCRLLLEKKKKQIILNQAQAELRHSALFVTAVQ